MPDILPGYLRYRVLNNNTGALVIDPLPHPHASHWEVTAMQRGAPGTQAIGRFLIPLYPPTSDRARAAKADYDNLAVGQRIEGYLSATGDSIGGQPRFSGIISRISKSLSAWTLEGWDSTWLAQSTHVELLEGLTATSDLFVSNYLSTYEITANDDFSGSFGTLAATYNQTGGAWSATTDEGLTCVTVAGLVDSTLLTKTAYPSAAATPVCAVESVFRLVTAGNVNAQGDAQAFVVAGAADSNNFFMGGANVIGTGGSTYTVNAEIWQKSGGVFTNRKTVTSILTGITSPWRCQVRMIGAGPTAGNYTWRVLINGIDSACSYTFASASAPTGAIGYRWGTGAAGSPAMFATNLIFHYRNNASPRFTSGTITAGSKTLSVANMNGQTFLDLWNIAATAEGFYWRKTPKQGYKADVIDFGASPGTDLSTSVRFLEGSNLLDCQLNPNAEEYATDIRLATQAGADNNGTILWHRMGSAGDAVLTDTVTELAITEFQAQRSAAQYLWALKSLNTATAKVLTVLRDADTVDAWRELDSVTVHSPTLGLQYQKVLVLGYTFDEGQPTQQLTVDQIPITGVLGMRRLVHAVESMGNTVKTR